MSERIRTAGLGVRERLGRYRRPAQPHPGVTRAGGWLRSLNDGDAVFYIVLAAGLLLRVAAMFAYRPIIFAGFESIEYLTAARDAGAGEDDTSIYPLVLIPFFKSGVPLLIPAVQHILGLLTGLFMYQLLRRLGVGSILATVGTMPVLLDAFQIAAEHHIVPDALFSLLVAAALIAVSKTPSPTIGTCVFAGLLIAGAATMRSYAAIVLVPVTAYVLVRRSRIVSFVGLIAAFGIAYGAFLGAFGSGSNTPLLSSTEGSVLWARTAPYARCAALELSVAERFYCLPAFRLRDLSPSDYAVNPRQPGQPPAPAGQASPDRRASVAIKVVIDRPLDFLRLAWGDAARHFAGKRQPEAGDVDQIGPVAFGPDVGTTRAELRSSRIIQVPARQDGGRGGERNARGDGGGRRKGQGAKPTAGEGGEFAAFGYAPGPLDFLRSYQETVYTRGPLLLLALILGLLGGAVGLRDDAERRMRAECLMLSLAGFLLLAGPAFGYPFDARYASATLPVLPAAGVLGVSVLYRRVVAEREARQAAGRRPKRAAAQQTRLRQASPDEAEHLTGLAIRSKAHWGYSDEFIDACRDELTVRREDIETTLVVALEEPGGGVVGFYRLEGGPPESELTHMFLHPDAIGRGYGRMMWDHAVDSAARLGVKRLIVESDPHAEAFYLEMGCKLIGGRPSPVDPNRVLPLLQYAIRDQGPSPG